MKRKILAVAMTLVILLSLAAPVLAMPPYPEGPEATPTAQSLRTRPAPGARPAKPLDQPNIKDYLRNRERQRLLEAGKLAEAEAFALTVHDRALVLLVEFGGTDTFTWNPGDTWDPYGRTDPTGALGQAVYDDDGNLVFGDCSNIITETETFTYTGPLHNEIPRPLSAEDRSGVSIWTEDFNKEWFEGFMFGDGVVFDYQREDGSVVYEDFTGKSVLDYTEDLSGGEYHVTGDVIGWLQVPHSTWYYATDMCPGARSAPGYDVPDSAAIPGAGNYRQLVRDTLDAVNAISDTIPGFDWANYDLDGDGIIDRLWIVHAGYGEEDATSLLDATPYSESAAWSHSSAVSPPYEVAPGIAAGPYIMMPENGGMSVFAHEAGHNLGADDLYAYGWGETSAGFWTLMSDSWTGHPIGFQPPAVDPWHLDNWGWLDPMVISDTSQVYEVTLGQASSFPDEEGMYRAAKITLPDGLLSLEAPVWEGEYYWWGGAENLANASMTTVEPIAIPSGTVSATLSFDLAYDIEDEWDFLWIQASEDGETWDTLTNENTQCEHDPDWIGPLYGFPDDLCGAGLGGFYGYNEDFPAPGVEEFDLSAYAGKSIYLRFWYMTDWGSLYYGTFVDQVMVTADGATLFSDNAEGGDAKWEYQAPWQRTNGVQSFTHNYYLQWRNVNENGGYDSALGQEEWRFGPANTGLLVWYNNNFYSNNEIDTFLEDEYGFGPKGRMLVIDSHPEPYRDPNLTPSGLGAENTNVSTRALVRDATFTLTDTVSFTMRSKDLYIVEDTDFEGRPAVSGFHDSKGYYPGVADEGDGRYWNTVDWDASATVPAKGHYSILGASDYPGYHIQYIGDLRDPVGWYGFWGWEPAGTGNPGDDHVQYGWHVELIEEAEDHTWARVRIWNSMMELDSDFAADATTAALGDNLTYTFSVNENIGGAADAFIGIPLPDTVDYVPNSTFGGAVVLPGGMSPEELAAIYAEGGREALQALASSSADDGAIIVWTGEIGTGQSAPDFGFEAEVKILRGEVDMTAGIFDEGVMFQTIAADTVDVAPTSTIYLPLVLRSE